MTLAVQVLNILDACTKHTWKQNEVLNRKDRRVKKKKKKGKE